MTGWEKRREWNTAQVVTPGVFFFLCKTECNQKNGRQRHRDTSYGDNLRPSRLPIVPGRCLTIVFHHSVLITYLYLVTNQVCSQVTTEFPESSISVELRGRVLQIWTLPQNSSKFLKQTIHKHVEPTVDLYVLQYSTA